jgi:hypothetical protein
MTLVTLLTLFSGKISIYNKVKYLPRRNAKEVNEIIGKALCTKKLIQSLQASGRQKVCH